jgi:hypothetical protein
LSRRWLFGAILAAIRRTCGTIIRPMPGPRRSRVNVTRERVPFASGSTANRRIRADRAVQGFGGPPVRRVVLAHPLRLRHLEPPDAAGALEGRSHFARGALDPAGTFDVGLPLREAGGIRRHLEHQLGCPVDFDVMHQLSHGLPPLVTLAAS